MGKCLRQPICSMGETSDCSLGVPVYNPCLQRSKLQLRFYVNRVLQAVCFARLGRLLSLRYGWPDALQGSRIPRSGLSYLWCCLACTQSGTQSGLCLGKSEARSEVYFAFLSLKPELNCFHLISLTNGQYLCFMAET